MQTLLLQEIGQALLSEQTLRKWSETKDGKETFSEDFSQKIMAITAGFVEMKILQESWNGKTYYIEAQMTVDPKEVSQRVAEVLNSKQKEKELEKREDTRTKAEQAKTETEKRVSELEEQKREIEARKKEMALK
jgi:septin family protein